MAILYWMWLYIGMYRDRDKTETLGLGLGLGLGLRRMSLGEDVRGQNVGNISVSDPSILWRTITWLIVTENESYRYQDRDDRDRDLGRDHRDRDDRDRDRPRPRQTETETHRDRDTPRPRHTETERLGLGTPLIINSLASFSRSERLIWNGTRPGQDHGSRTADVQIKSVLMSDFSPIHYLLEYKQFIVKNCAIFELKWSEKSSERNRLFTVPHVLNAKNRKKSPICVYIYRSH